MGKQEEADIGGVAALPVDDRSRLEAAAAWRMRIQTNPACEHEPEFLAWQADPLNRVAMNDTQEAWHAFDGHGAAPEVMALKRDALARAHRAASRRWVPRPGWAQAMAASVLIAIALGAGVIVLLRQPTTYSTEIGERRVVTLDDGSHLSLDSDTEVHVRYSRDTRELALERGRARFDVTHDSARPFVVTAGSQTITAVGTSFDVERIGTEVLVTLLEGHVVVSPAIIHSLPLAEPVVKPTPVSPLPVSLAAGQRLVAARDDHPVITETNLQTAAAWESGTLVFNDEAIIAAVARVNRYATKPIIVDPSVEGLRISGVFKAGDVSAFIEAVTNYFPVQATTGPNRQILLQRRS